MIVLSPPRGLPMFHCTEVVLYISSLSSYSCRSLIHTTYTRLAHSPTFPESTSWVSELSCRTKRAHPADVASVEHGDGVLVHTSQCDDVDPQQLARPPHPDLCMWSTVLHVQNTLWTKHKTPFFSLPKFAKPFFVKTSN